MDELTIDVHSCDLQEPACSALAAQEYGVESFYRLHPSGLSVVDLDDWRPSKVAGYNARRCERLGNYFKPEISRDEWAEDINELRASARERQGRAMPWSYLNPQEFARDPLPRCPRHGYYVHGVVAPGAKLVAYAQIYQCGDAARVNTILGHAGFMEDGVVWLLLLRALEYHRDECDAAHGIYYTHDSGHGGGLRYFKERLGFRPASVKWT